MVIDSSALLAILFFEADAAIYSRAIQNAEIKLLAAPTLLEAAIVAESRKGPSAGRDLDLLVHRAKMDIIPLRPSALPSFRPSATLQRRRLYPRRS